MPNIPFRQVKNRFSVEYLFQEEKKVFFRSKRDVFSFEPPQKIFSKNPSMGGIEHRSFVILPVFR